MAIKRRGKREREARKRRKRGHYASSANGMVTLKLGHKKAGEYIRKENFHFDFNLGVWSMPKDSQSVR